MSNYQIIIAAVDLHPEADEQTLQRAKSLAKANNAELYVVHAIESLTAYGAAYAYPSMIDITEELTAEHRTALLAEATKLGIGEDKLIIAQGAPNNVIVHQAEALKADLIIVGARSRHGIGLLLSSTTDAVLHNAPCDVLAIHLKD